MKRVRVFLTGLQSQRLRERCGRRRSAGTKLLESGINGDNGKPRCSLRIVGGKRSGRNHGAVAQSLRLAHAWPTRTNWRTSYSSRKRASERMSATDSSLRATKRRGASAVVGLRELLATAANAGSGPHR
jgi:hypothetical protein